jgi:hypothetical protein
MLSRLPSPLERIVGDHAQKVVEEERYNAITADRAAEAARTAIVRTAHATVEYVLSGRSGISEVKHMDRLVTRVNTAAVLSLIGEPDDNDGHLATPVVVMERDVNRHGVNYSEVGVALSGVAVELGLFTRGIDKADAKTVASEQLTEGQANIYVRQGEARPEIAGRTGAWIAEQDMPSHYQGRGYYDKPEQLGNLAGSMLRAMSDPSLNANFHTLDFVTGVSPDLAAAVKDHSVPVSDFREHITLPDWLSATQQTA